MLLEIPKTQCYKMVERKGVKDPTLRKIRNKIEYSLKIKINS